MNRVSLSIFLALGALLPFQVIGQRTCGTGDYYQKALLADPGLLQRTKDAKALSDQWMNSHPEDAFKTTGEILTIPVVVHVIYENPSENISDAQVISQIQVLNDDYRKLNADTGDVPSQFKGVAADTEINFCLATRDPDGNPTSGITRTSTTLSDFSGSGDPKSSANGGKDGWPNDEYLNFWVCDLGGGLLGYATFPGGNPSSDGVVCGYQYIGKAPDNPFGGSFNKGRTGTHEVGHYLGLSHTFQGGCSGMALSNCGFSGDGICDTPPTSSSNYNCPAVTQNTCSESPVDQTDMHMNYMDYVDDGCMNIFTDDQKSRMRSVINSSRSSLLSSFGCTPLTTLDASVELVTPMNDTLCESTHFAPVVTLFNYGSATLTSATIYYQIDSETELTYDWTGSIPMLISEEVTLPFTVVSQGAHTFRAWTSSPNGGVDELSTNDTSSTAFNFMNGNDVTLTLTYGTFSLAYKVNWEVLDQSGALVKSGGGYSQNTTTVESICLPTACYTFKLYDIVNNGVGSFSMVNEQGDTIVNENDIADYTFAFCVIASIEESSDLNDVFAVYPNPSNGLVYVNTSRLNESIEEIVVLNTVGQIVYSIQEPEMSAGSTQLNLASLQGGVYFITIKTAESSFTKKISLIH